MKMLAFASRNLREMLRDPLNLAFGIGFPLLVLLLLSAIEANIPVTLFEIGRLAPGVTIFGLSFMALFAGLLIAKDRSTSFLMRLFASPLRAADFIAGYALPLVLMSVLQNVICYLAAICLGLPVSWNILLSMLAAIPAAVLFIGIGLLAGSALNDKLVGGVCGALLTNLSAWLSGIWFDLQLVGGAFAAVAEALPFVHAVEAVRAAAAGDYGRIFPHLVWVIGYAAAVFVLAILVFRRRMKGERA
jgi:ABC-2 type transport system permease protein